MTTLHLIPWSYAQGSRAKTYTLSCQQAAELRQKLSSLGKIPARFINARRQVLSYHEASK